MEKKLYRSRTDAVFSGVCGGMARYLGIDSSVMRVITVILFFMGTVGFWMYVVLAIIIPKEPYAGFLDQYNAADGNGNYPGGYDARNMNAYQNGYPNEYPNQNGYPNGNYGGAPYGNYPNGYPNPNGFANPNGYPNQNGYGAPYGNYPNGYPNPNGFYGAPYGAAPMNDPYQVPIEPVAPMEPVAPAAPVEPAAEKSDDLI